MMSKRSLFIVLGVIILAAVLWGIFRAEEVYRITNHPSSGESIIAFGDSLTHGIGASDGEDFPSQLSRAIGRPIVNLGVPGDTTREGLLRVDDIAKERPQIVILLFGGNDSLRKMPVEETFQNLDMLISRIHEMDAVVLLVGIQSGILNDRYDEEFEMLAKRHKTAYVPNILDGILGNAKLLSDQIHPNDAGYAKMTERILPTLRSLIE